MWGFCDNDNNNITVQAKVEADSKTVDLAILVVGTWAALVLTYSGGDGCSVVNFTSII